MDRSAPISQARKELNNLPEQLRRKREALKVTRRGVPVLAIMPWEEYEAIIETLEIAADRELMEQLRQSLRQAEKGEIEAWDKVRGRFD